MANFLSVWARLVRLDHGIMSAVGVLIGMLVANHQGNEIPMQILAMALAVPILVQISSFALNDLLDIGTDRHNKRKDRPLANKEIGENVAKATVVAGFVLGNIIAWAINPLAGAVASIFTILSIAYDYKLKDLPLVGNVYIALSMVIAFFFGMWAISPQIENIPIAIILLSILGFFSGLGREISKSVQDMEGDMHARKSKTLPIIIGRKNSLFLAALCYAIFAIACVYLLYSYSLDFNVLSGGLIIISALAFLAMAHELAFSKDVDRERLAKFRKASLYSLMAGLAGVLIASIV